MIKRVVIGAGIVVLAAVLLVGAKPVILYVSTAFRMAGDAVDESVPVDFKIEMARDMIRDLEPVIKKNETSIVKEEVAVGRLQKEIDALEEKLTGDKDEVLTLQADLARKDAAYVYAGQTYTPKQVEDDLSRRFERYQVNEETLNTLKKVSEARNKGLEAAKQKLVGMKAAKRQLEVDVENLLARKEMLAAAEVTSEFRIDSGQLGDAQKLVDDLDARLEVAERMVHADVYYSDEIQLDESGSEGIADRVAKYFGTDEPEIEMVATHD